MSDRDVPKISLVMIVRNEERNLPRALGSAKDIVDEMIVVDTGSVDRTVEIAESFGANVDFFDWRDDFAAAKNAAIERASGEWLLLMDADDEIHPDDRYAVRELMQHDEVDCFLFDTHSYIGGGTQIVRMQQPRLVRNVPKHRFTGRIHETIPLTGSVLSYTDIRVLHYGYLETEIGAKRKIARNLSLLRKQMGERPSPSGAYYMGMEYLRSGEYGPAVEWLERAESMFLEAGEKPPPDLYKRRIVALIGSDRFEEAYRDIGSALALHPEFTDLLFLRGEGLEREGRWPEAVRAYRQCVARGEAPARYLSMAGVGSYSALYRIGRRLAAMDRREEAMQAYLDALAANGAYIPAIYALAELLADQYPDRRILSFLRERFDLSVPAAVRLFAEAFANAGAYRLSMRFIQALGRLPEDDGLVALRIKALLFTGEGQRAMEEAAAVRPGHANFPTVSFCRVLYAWQSGNGGLAGQLLTEMRRLDGIDSKQLDVWAMLNEMLHGISAEGDGGDSATTPDSDCRQPDETKERILLNVLELLYGLGMKQWIAPIRQQLPSKLRLGGKLADFIGFLLRNREAEEAGHWLDLAPSDDSDAEFALLRGEAELSLGRLQAAQEAFRQALARRPTHYKAIAGLAGAVYAAARSWMEERGMIRISLCMIVKDEEEHLPAALESVKGIADEIVVVDTGSTDGTIAIAERWGAKLVCSEWKDDFAAARNEAIERASGQWIMCLDADERLDPASGKLIPGLIGRGDVDGYEFTIVSRTDAGETLVDRRLSLFRNKPQYRFVGAIHEQIPAETFAASGRKLESSDAVIHHDGYLDSVVRRKNKRRRNEELIRKQLEAEPGHPHLLYSLAAELMQRESHGEAACHLEKALSKWSPDNPRYADAVLKLALCYLAERRHAECGRLLEAGIRQFPDFTDLHYYRGVCLMALREWEEAGVCLRACIRMGPAPGHYSGNGGLATIHGYAALAGIGESLAAEMKLWAHPGSQPEPAEKGEERT